MDINSRIPDLSWSGLGGCDFEEWVQFGRRMMAGLATLSLGDIKTTRSSASRQRTHTAWSAQRVLLEPNSGFVRRLGSRCSLLR